MNLDEDCEWYLSNFTDSSEIDPSKNKTLCEAFFGSTKSEIVNETDNVSFNLTESVDPAIFPLELITPTDSEDLTATTIESILSQAISATTDPTFLSLDDSLEPEDILSSTNFELLLEKDMFNSTIESITEESAENYTFDNGSHLADTISRLGDIEASTILDLFDTTTTTRAVHTTTSTTSTIFTTLNATVKSILVEPIQTTMHHFEEYLTTTVPSGVNEDNETVCKWYLPTVHQAPTALGYAGIALWALGFAITIILIGMYIKQFHFIYTTAHKSFRRHLYSINSIYVVMALMTSIGSGVPRAHAVCSAVKDIFMAIGIGHFVDLTIMMYGGENVMAWYLKDKKINIRVIPILKCFFCAPQCKTTKRSVNVLKWLVWQMKWSQAIYYLIKLIWRKSLENSTGLVDHNSTYSFLYVHVINVISFLSGVFSLLIISSLVTDDLQVKYNYSVKAKSVRFTILATKLQRLFFEILDGFDVFPCTAYVSKRFYKNVIKDFIYLVEVLILGTITFCVYTKKGEFELGNPKEAPREILEKENSENELDENGFTEEGAMLPVTKPSNKFHAESAC